MCDTCVVCYYLCFCVVVSLVDFFVFVSGFEGLTVIPFVVSGFAVFGSVVLQVLLQHAVIVNMLNMIVVVMIVFMVMIVLVFNWLYCYCCFVMVLRV